MLVFAEATTSNGTHLLPFKGGAFKGMRTITPSYFTVSGGQVRPTYDTLGLIPLIVLMSTLLNFRFAKISIMPDFTPNAYMMENHGDKGDEPWEVFAWCVRDAIAKKASLIKLDEKLNLKDKYAFVALMNGDADNAEINGQIF